MKRQKTTAFELVLLVVGVAAAGLGFQLINSAEGLEQVMRVTAIFSWLILMVLFISLSISVDIAKRQLEATHEIQSLIEQQSRKKK